MEASGLVKRKVYAEVPPRVQYSLTETGLSLKPILDSMVKWGNEYREKQRGCPEIGTQETKNPAR